MLDGAQRRTPSACVRRFMFEAGREVMGLLDREEDSRDVLARVLLHSMGRELGALLKGRFENVLQVQARGCMAYACSCGPVKQALW